MSFISFVFMRVADDVDRNSKCSNTCRHPILLPFGVMHGVMVSTSAVLACYQGLNVLHAVCTPLHLDHLLETFLGAVRRL